MKTTGLQKIKGRIRERDLKYKDISIQLGVSERTLSQKLNGHSKFNVDEAYVLSKILDFSIQEVWTFFWKATCKNALKKIYREEI